jgi:hypothetical protein
LTLAELEVALKHIVDKRVRPSWTLEEISRLFEGLYHEVESERETHLDLHTVLVFNVNPQVFNLDRS